MSLYPNELVIHDGNAHLYAAKQHIGEDGLPRSKGLIPRNYQTHPVGCYASIKPYSAINFPLIPRAEWSQRLRDQTAAGARLSDIRMRGNNGQMIPSRDQGNRGYCWFHSGVSAILLSRASLNMKYVDLSAYAGACVIKNFRDEGGWGAQGVDFLVSRGVPTSQFWPQKSVLRSNDNPQTWENAKLHRVLEGWIDLAEAQYDRKLTFEQCISLYLVGFPTVNDHNFWSHSIAGADAVEGNAQWGYTRADSGKLMELYEFDLYWGMNNPVTGGWGYRLWNSWADSWSDQGMGVLTGNQAIPDGGVGLLSTVASVA